MSKVDVGLAMEVNNGVISMTGVEVVKDVC
jgi:hypothetical protein